MKKNWSNTALVAYSLIPKIVKEINHGIKTRVNSSFQSRHLKFGISTEQLICEILDLTEEKRKMVNLRYVVSTALERISSDDRSVLEARIINKKTYQTIADEANIALRTVFRRVASAETAFSSALKRAGFTEDWFEKEYGKDKYILPIRERVLNDKYFIAKSL